MSSVVERPSVLAATTVSVCAPGVVVSSLPPDRIVLPRSSPAEQSARAAGAPGWVHEYFGLTTCPKVYVALFLMPLTATVGAARTVSVCVAPTALVPAEELTAPGLFDSVPGVAV